MLPATFAPVASAADGSSGSLRAAIIQANANKEDNTINLSGGVYQLSLVNTAGQENAAATGDLDINDIGHTITIRGAGAGATIIDGGLFDRVFQVMYNATLVLEDLTVRGGIARDSGVAGASTDEQAAVGGGILNAGTVTLDSVVITSCTAAAGFGKDGTPGNLTAPGSGGFSASGGGIFNGGTLTIISSVIQVDTAHGGKGGGGSSSGDPNGTGGDGGAGFGGGIFDIGVLTVKQSTIASNAAYGGFGGDGGTDDFGIGPLGGSGGMAYGGGLYVDQHAAPALVIDSTFASNIVGGGFGGQGGNGGNAGNQLTDPGSMGGRGGNGAFSDGGGIAAQGAITLYNSTIAGNEADQSQGGDGGVGGHGVPAGSKGLAGLQGHGAGGGIWAPVDTGAAGLVSSISSLIAMNSTDTFTFPDVEVTFANATNTLIQVSDGAVGITNGGNGDILDVDPKLGSLTNNGGPVPTMALLPGSPAIDAGSNPLGLTADGRGFTPRVAGASSDIGAFETGATTPPGGSGPGGTGPGAVTPILAMTVKVKKRKEIRVTDPSTGAIKFSVYPFGKAFRGNFQMQTADVNGDGVADLIVRRKISRRKFVTKVFNGVSGKPLPARLASNVAAAREILA